MSKIDFNVLVESFLYENLTQQLTPRTGDNVLDSIGAVAGFVSQLVFREGGYARQDTLISSKPIWPYADTFEYMRAALVRAGLLKNTRESVKILAQVIENKKPQNVQELLQGLLELTPNITIPETLTSELEDKVQYLQANKDNYRNYFNTTLKQLNDETSVIAAEPYLTLTPHDSIVKVLQDFGGYDIDITEKIIYYPGESKYTQMGPHIEGLVMSSIIEISKLMLIFYREFVQTNADKILEHIKYFLEETDRWFIFRGIDRPTLSKLVTDIAGKRPQDVAQAATSAGKEMNPSDAVTKYIHDDYIAFVNGKSSLVLESYDWEPIEKPESSEGKFNFISATESVNNFDKFYKKVLIEEEATPPPLPPGANQPQPVTLIKNINDFRILPGTGQRVFQSFVHLFNNMKKGEVPSKWEKRSEYARKGVDLFGQFAQGLSNLASGFKGF